MKAKPKDILSLWQRIDIYQLLKDKNRGKGKYIIYNLPDIAAGKVGYDQLQNKVLKDAILKCRFMMGYDVCHLPMWDIYDQKVEKNALGQRLSQAGKLTPQDLRNICREYADKSIKNQKSQLKRAGIFSCWDEDRHTPRQNEVELGKSFCSLRESSQVQKGRKPVYWCINCKNSIPNLEVGFAVKKVKSAYIKIPIMEGLEDLGGKAYLLATVEPVWRIAATNAFILNPSRNYVIFQIEDEIYVAFEDSVAQIASKLNREEVRILRKIAGAKLNISTAIHPLTFKELPVFYSEFAIPSSTIGCLCLAPNHDAKDYLFALKNGLELYSVVDEDGNFTDIAGQICGANVLESDEIVSHELSKEDYLITSELNIQTLPHCLQCKTSLIIRTVDQWFFSVGTNDLQKRLEASLQEVNWTPECDKKNVIEKIRKSSDWPISSQSIWGLSLSVCYCERCDCQLPISKEELDQPQKLSKSDLACPHCGSKEFHWNKEMIDSQIGLPAIYDLFLYNQESKGLNLIADLYLENQKLHQKWMPQLLFLSMSKKGCVPFKNAAVYPSSIASQKGCKFTEELNDQLQDLLRSLHPDVLRAWLIEHDKISCLSDLKRSIAQSEHRYKVVRGVCLSLLNRINRLRRSETEPLLDVSYETLLSQASALDKLALSRLSQVGLEATDALRRNKVKKAHRLLYNLCAEIECLYLTSLKKSRRPKSIDSMESGSYESLSYMLIQLLILMAPVFSYTAEEIWQDLVANLRRGNKPSVFLNEWQSVEADLIDKKSVAEWMKILKSQRANKSSPQTPSPLVGEGRDGGLRLSGKL